MHPSTTHRPGTLPVADCLFGAFGGDVFPLTCLPTPLHNPQVYVALSRATSLLTTRILSFDPAAIRVDPKVVDFYRGIEGVSQAAGGVGHRPGTTPLPDQQVERMAASRNAAVARRSAATKFPRASASASSV